MVLGSISLCLGASPQGTKVSDFVPQNSLSPLQAGKDQAAKNTLQPKAAASQQKVPAKKPMLGRQLSSKKPPQIWLPAAPPKSNGAAAKVEALKKAKELAGAATPKPRAPWYELKKKDHAAWYDVTHDSALTHRKKKRFGRLSSNALAPRKNSRLKGLTAKLHKLSATPSIFGTAIIPSDPKLGMTGGNHSKAKRRHNIREVKKPDTWFAEYSFKHKLGGATSSGIQSGRLVGRLGGSTSAVTNETLLTAARKYLKPGQFAEFLKAYKTSTPSSSVAGIGRSSRMTTNPYRYGSGLSGRSKF